MGEDCVGMLEHVFINTFKGSFTKQVLFVCLIYRLNHAFGIIQSIFSRHFLNKTIKNQVA